MEARRKRRSESDDGDGWITTYADMITLLMAFFVMLYAISQVDQEKFEAFVRGLEVFGNTSSQGILDGSIAIVDEAGAVPAEIDPPIDITPPDPRPQPPVPEDTAPEPAPEDPDRLDPEEIRGALAASLATEGLDPGVAEVRRDERGITISVATDDVLFRLGSAEISPLGRRVVAAVGSVLASLPYPVVVEGHTDDLPLRRAGYDNWNLSSDRALAVLKLLFGDHGIDQPRLSAVGYGEWQPRAANDSQRGRALNRRVDVIIVDGDSNG